MTKFQVCGIGCRRGIRFPGREWRNPRGPPDGDKAFGVISGKKQSLAVPEKGGEQRACSGQKARRDFPLCFQEERWMVFRERLLYKKAQTEHPERSARNTRDWSRIEAVHLNPNKDYAATEAA